MKIYIVTSGSYSDYQINAVFSSRAKAKKFIDTIRSLDEIRIEEWPVNKYDVLIGKFNTGKLSIYMVSMFKNGNIEKIEKEEITSYRIENSLEGNYNFWTENRIGMWVIAKNKRHAIKIVNEKRVQLIATNKWPEKVVAIQDTP